jgi:Flp pilus assembly protein TadD
MRAWALELQGDYAESLDDAAKAAAEDPSLPMGQLVYGRALVETGDVSNGLPHLENVLRMEPGNLEAHLTLAKTYSKLGRSEDARRERLLCLSISQQGVTPLAAP